jgi:serine/threonine protein kinase
MAFDKLTDCSTETDCADTLLPGMFLLTGQYRITRFLSSGGFGITYLAKDRNNRDVVLKECFVPDFCRRNQGRVEVWSEAHAPNHKRAIRAFLAEAHVLAALSHPNVVRVLEVFEENGTAYMALDYIKGHDLQQIVDEGRAFLAPDQMVIMARKLVSALGHIHHEGYLHCDVSPDNICVGEDGEPVLIDFGSVQSRTGGAGKDSFSMVKDGYSPHEFYTTTAPRGPWSDLYALGASLYHAVSGAAPVDGPSRLAALRGGEPDPVEPLAGRFAGYPAGFLESIDRALAVRSAERHQSAQAWLDAIAAPERKVLLLRPTVSQPNMARRLTVGA